MTLAPQHATIVGVGAACSPATLGVDFGPEPGSPESKAPIRSKDPPGSAYFTSLVSTSWLLGPLASRASVSASFDGSQSSPRDTIPISSSTTKPADLLLLATPAAADSMSRCTDPWGPMPSNQRPRMRASRGECSTSPSEVLPFMNALACGSTRLHGASALNFAQTDDGFATAIARARRHTDTQVDRTLEADDSTTEASPERAARCSHEKWAAASSFSTSEHHACRAADGHIGSMPR